MQNAVRVLVLVAALAACGSYELEPLPLNITLQAERTTAAPGDSLLFEVTAQGGNLIGLGIDWGDGESLVISTGGARTASTWQRHAYRETGSYEVRAEITDAEAGSKNAVLNVHIQ